MEEEFNRVIKKFLLCLMLADIYECHEDLVEEVMNNPEVILLDPHADILRNSFWQS